MPTTAVALVPEASQMRVNVTISAIGMLEEDDIQRNIHNVNMYDVPADYKPFILI
jgi:hypothetical protein